jgi:hypothetical protein
MATPQAQESAGTLKDAVAPLLGVLILAAFAAFIVFMLSNLDLTDTEWARATYLFAGVEAVAFAAAGYFFGTQVQRGKVEDAMSQAKSAEQVKDAAVETARSERRASKVFAEGYIATATRGGGLLSEDPANEALLAQARALLAD